MPESDGDCETASKEGIGRERYENCPEAFLFDEIIRPKKGHFGDEIRLF
jgi:hypothetical protein